MTTRADKQERNLTTRQERLTSRKGHPVHPARMHHRSLHSKFIPPDSGDLRRDVQLLRRAFKELAQEVEDVLNEIGCFIDTEGRAEEVSPKLRAWMDSRYI